MANKTTATEASVLEFIESIEDQIKRSDSMRLMKMMEEITGHSPKMWGPSIIGFDAYHYKYESGREGDMLKTGFSPRKAALSLYIMPGFKRYEEILNRLGKYKISGKSCLYIKKLSDVNEEALRELIREGFQYMTNKYG
ncbi:MAG: DUF1801 domain-containing protein [Cytophagales bacterium]|nr:DUF1801 domain-containing protein [Cytophagales bacterium]